MPDTTGQPLPGEVFERNVAALVPPPPVELKGGIISPDNYKSFVVNIRPNKWKETFWIGRIDNYVNAQFIADLVYYYSGRPSFHLKNLNFKFPPLECIGTSTPLTDREMCLQYASSIAKGDESKGRRVDFIKSVKKLALEEVQSVEVKRVLLQFRDESGSAAVSVEGVAGKNDDDEGVQAGHPTPMEVDDESEQATRFSLVRSSQDGLEALNPHVEGGNAHVPGFDISGPGFNLLSDLTPLEFLRMDALLKNGDLEDHHVSLNNDEEESCSSTSRHLDKNSFDLPHCPSVYHDNFRLHFFAMEDAWVD